jgi:hypothetical protein
MQSYTFEVSNGSPSSVFSYWFLNRIELPDHKEPAKTAAMTRGPNLNYRGINLLEHARMSERMVATRTLAIRAN